MNLHPALDRVAIAGFLALLSCAFSVSCASQARTPNVEGYATVDADSLPGDVYAHPHVRFGEGNAYLVQGAWYYPSASGWVRFRDEPLELVHARARPQLASTNATSATLRTTP